MSAGSSKASFDSLPNRGCWLIHKARCRPCTHHHPQQKRGTVRYLVPNTPRVQVGEGGEGRAGNGWGEGEARKRQWHRAWVRGKERRESGSGEGGGKQEEEERGGKMVGWKRKGQGRETWRR